jgi:agmatinase
MKELLELTGVKKTFLGFQEEFSKAKAVVIPVPYDATTSYGSGTRFGPSAIIDASSQLELYDIEVGKNICDEVPVHTLDELAINKGSPEKTLESVEKAVNLVAKEGKKPVVLGGEHSITAGAVAGLGEKDFSVLQIDAHSDLRDSYEGTKCSHAAAMRRVREITKSTVQVGVRSMCDEEVEYIEKEKPAIFFADDLIRNRRNDGLVAADLKQITSGLKDKVYVTVDIDGFDPSLVPGTGTPEPGGLLWNDVLSIMRAIKDKEILGFDVVEVMPAPPLRTSEFLAAKLTYKMMGYFWAR